MDDNINTYPCSIICRNNISCRQGADVPYKDKEDEHDEKDLPEVNSFCMCAFLAIGDNDHSRFYKCIDMYTSLAYYFSYM